MKNMTLKFAVVYGLVLSLNSVACSTSKSSGVPVTVFSTKSAQDPQATDLFGQFIWPDTQDLGQYELAKVSDPLFDPVPTWGAYSGVGQYSSEGSEIPLQTHITVTLNSKESIDPFIDFCKTLGHEDGVILIYTKADGLFHERIEDIVGVHIEMTDAGG